MAKIREQKLADMRSVLEQTSILIASDEHNPQVRLSFADSAHKLAERLLDAAERETPTPTWPTDRSIAIIRSSRDLFEDDRAQLRSAMLNDPIIKAAIEVVSELTHDGRVRTENMAILDDAVKKAGLLNG